MSGPTVLAIETSTPACGVGVAADGVLLIQYTLNVGLAHSSRLVGLVRRALSEASLELSRLDAVAVSIGPGSFTGIRIGMGTALGLVAGSEIRLVGVPTLDALAWRHRHFDGLVCAFVDARRSEVYYSLYRCRDDAARRLSEFAVARPEAMLAAAEKWACAEGVREVLLAGPVDALGAGDGSGDRTVSGVRLRAVPPEYGLPDPGAVAMLGIRLVREGASCAPGELRPIYVRSSDAELRKRGSGGAR